MYDFHELLYNLKNEKNLDVKKYLPDKFAKLGDWRSTPYLGELLINKEETDILRIECAESLGKQGDFNAIKYLKKVLNDPNPEIRRTTIWSLGQINDINNVNYIFELSTDEDLMVRRWVAKSLGRLKSDLSLNKLNSYLKSNFHDDDKLVADIIRSLNHLHHLIPKSKSHHYLELSYSILESNKSKFVKQAASILLFNILSMGNEPNAKMLLSLIEQCPLNDPLIRPNLIKSMGFSNEVEKIHNFKDPIKYQAIGISHNIDLLIQSLSNNSDPNEILNILKGFEYARHYFNYDNFINHSDLNIHNQALKLYALNRSPIEIIIDSFNENYGKYNALEILKYYGDRALKIYEQSSFSTDKMARQISVKAMTSLIMYENTKNKSHLISMLNKISKNDVIWHIRRDARNGIEYFNSLN